ncbi:MAG: hypothetical protein US11_C0002G0036 [Candidatus Roizmanbacteria bacterium GW2011_GWA2_36_23]|uniref:Serine aminopeptidase S33 domain-containing protein n=1 Tax=Candidatus Roizmanbacteria bacterium GW2011_GWA2_36_23 TaxID=1618480 RepID=A0A0G0E8Y2_9BACT|nr:MAG: hypothetical protein US11_C0002G0036 [Candidatus Roizmanbacteria bacterium GW2011_GWA2_36_23]
MESKLYFYNSKGNKLCGILADPGSKPKSVIIIVHGFNSNKNTKNFVRLKEILYENKIASFRFDIFGHGESEGDFAELTISEAVDDILQSIKYLKKIGYSKIGLVGSSFGGNASIIVASKYKDLSLLVLKSPVSDYEERNQKMLSRSELEDWKSKGYRDMNDDGKIIKINYAFVVDYINNNGYEVANLINIPTLIVHGDADESVPVRQSIKISKLIPNCSLVLIHGANHVYTKPEHAQQMLKHISEFIINNL